jgi:2-polyprenyl-3-methyl-5-hydroxy-6-metoxy-1,4-benzoquinol methylase
MNNIIEMRLVEKLNEISKRLLVEFPQHAEYIALQKTWNEPVLRYFNRWLPPRGGNIVSIGSFLGATEIALADEVREVVCCDLDDFLPVNRPSNLSFNKINLDSNMLNMPEGHFDACLCIEVIEHLRWSPIPLLQWMRQHCNLVLITTPDDNEWPPVKNAPWTTTKHFSQIPVATADSMGNPIPMEHCKQYSQTELVELLDKTGFRVIEVQRVGIGGHQILVLATPRNTSTDASTLQIANSEQPVAELLRELASQQRVIDALKGTLDELYSSTSWRVTAPLRSIKAKLLR